MQRNYFEERAKTLSAERKVIILLIIIVSLCVIMAVCFIIVTFAKRLSERKKEEMRLRDMMKKMAARLQDSERARLDDKSFMINKLEVEKQAIRDSYMSRNKLAFDRLKHICGLLVSSGNAEPKSYHAFFAEMKKAVHIYSDHEGQRQFEADIDKAMDNIMTGFRNDLPGLPEDDYRLFGYLCAGFDYGTVIVLLKCQSSGAFYARKYRIVNKIKALSPDNPNKEKYLAIVKSILR